MDPAAAIEQQPPRGSARPLPSIRDPHAKPHTVGPGDRLVSLNAVRRLFQSMDLGYTIGETDEDGRTPLYLAAWEGDVELVDVLAELGADLNVRSDDAEGVTPLYVAAEQGHRDVVRYLCAHGADVNMAMYDGCTPLYAAAQDASVDMVQLLLELGADRHMASNTNITPIWAAAMAGHAASVHTLAHWKSTPAKRTAYVNHPNDRGNAPLHVACEEGHIQSVVELIECGACINQATTGPSRSGMTPLHFAASFGHFAVAHTLLSYHADVRCVTNSGQTPLYISASHGHTDIVTLLVAYGNADVGCCKHNGVSPIFAAASNGHTVTVRELAKLGGDVNRRRRGGETPLHAAVDGAHFSTVLELLLLGADPELESDGGVRPADLATPELATMIRGVVTHGVSREPPLSPEESKRRLFYFAWNNSNDGFRVFTLLAMRCRDMKDTTTEETVRSQLGDLADLPEDVLKLVAKKAKVPWVPKPLWRPEAPRAADKAGGDAMEVDGAGSDGAEGGHQHKRPRT